MRNKRIVHILGSLAYSGAEKMLHTAINYFKENNHELHILILSSKPGDYCKVLEKAGFKIHFIKSNAYKNQKSLPHLIDHFEKLYKFLKEHQFDAVHLHFEWANFWHMLVARAATNKNIVRSMHNVFQFNGVTRFERIVQRFISKKFLKVKQVAISPSVFNFERKHFFNTTTLVRNWIDYSEFQPVLSEIEKNKFREQFDIPTNSFVIISVGSCQQVKNHDHIIKAVANLSKKGIDITYLHLGNGILHEKENELAHKLNVANKIRFVGNVTNVRAYLVTSDVFVMPSAFEGIGISLMEALSCKIPAVVYNTFGLIDLVNHNVNGLIVNNSIEELTNAILELYKNPEKRKEMGNAARQLITQEFKMEDSLNKLMKIYR